METTHESSVSPHRWKDTDNVSTMYYPVAAHSEFPEQYRADAPPYIADYCATGCRIHSLQYGSGHPLPGAALPTKDVPDKATDNGYRAGRPLHVDGPFP